MAECPIRDAQLHRLLLPAGEIILAVPLSPRRALPLRSGPHHATAFKRETRAIIYTDSTLGVVHISRRRDTAPGAGCARYPRSSRLCLGQPLSNGDNGRILPP